MSRILAAFGGLVVNLSSFASMNLCVFPCDFLSRRDLPYCGLRGRGKISRKLLLRLDRGIDRPDSLGRRLSMSGGLDQVPDCSEPERRHVMINSLILSVLDHIGLVVDANIAAVADTLAKASPCR